jgi:hypothetical protein
MKHIQQLPSHPSQSGGRAPFRRRYMRLSNRAAEGLEMYGFRAACYLHGLLAKHGFDSLIRTFHYRSLYFTLGPILKMELLVPAAELNQVREIIRPESIEIV